MAKSSTAVITCGDIAVNEFEEGKNVAIWWWICLFRLLSWTTINVAWINMFHNFFELVVRFPSPFLSEFVFFWSVLGFRLMLTTLSRKSFADYLFTFDMYFSKIFK